MKEQSKEQEKPMETLYKKGLAVGSSDIRNDTITFNFRKEKFVFPTIQLSGMCDFNGYFYTAKVKDLRILKGIGRKIVGQL